MTGVPFVVTLLTALGCGLMAGALFAFSAFVMPALGRLEPANGVAAMQSINVLAVTPAFMTAFFGPAIACLGLIVWAVVGTGERPTALLIVGGGLYIVGTFGVTIVANVPLNDRLAALDPQSADARFWRHYISRWTRWNHLRVAAALAAAAALTIALTT